MNTKLFLWLFLLVIYFLILSFNLTGLPLYLDEGIYIFWAYLFSTNPSYAYISMQDGKTPLFIWATSSLNLLFNNFLYSARLVSVFASVVSLGCWMVLGAKMFGNKILKWIFILFLVTPFNILISRLGFVDSLLIAFYSLSILGLFLAKESAMKKQKVKTFTAAFFSGLFLGLAFLTKTTAKIFFAVEIFILVFWGLQLLRKKEFRSAALLTVSGLIVSGIYFEIMGYLKFGALRHWEMIANKESVLIFSLPELFRKFFIEHNFTAQVKNLPVSIEYFAVYLGPILPFFATGVAYIFKTGKHYWILLLVLILTCAVFLSAKVPASRYFAIIIPELLIICAFGLFWIWQKKSMALKIVSIILLCFSGFLSFKMISDPINAYYSSDDQANFVDYNLNALGLKESVDYLAPKKDTATVAVTGIWGVSEGSLVSFKEKGIETYQSAKPVIGLLKDKQPCEENFRELEGKCWKIDFGEITKSPKEKYVYFISEDIDIETLEKLINLEVAKDFKRQKTNLQVYLLRLN